MYCDDTLPSMTYRPGYIFPVTVISFASLSFVITTPNGLRQSDSSSMGLSISLPFVSVWMLVLLYYDPGSILYPLNFIAPGLSTWLISYALGIFLAVNASVLNNVLNKINRYIVAAMFCVATLVFLYMRNNYVLSCFSGTKGDPFIVVFLSLAVVCLCRLTKRNMVPLIFVGKHSMNMYLMHTFVSGYFFHDFIYSFKYPILIFVVLFLISLLLSVILEFVKTKLKFYQLQNKICSLLGT